MIDSGTQEATVVQYGTMEYGEWLDFKLGSGVWRAYRQLKKVISPDRRVLNFSDFSLAYGFDPEHLWGAI